MNCLRFVILILICAVANWNAQGAFGYDQWEVVHEFPGVDFQEVFFANGKFVATTGQGNITTSTNGTSWEQRYRGSSKGIRGFAFGNGSFVAVGFVSNGSGFVMTSPDGETWSEGKAPPGGMLRDIAFGHGQFVAVTSQRIYASVDGKSWTRVGHDTTNSYSGISFANNQFIAFGSVISVSTNGIAWTEPEKRDLLIDSIAYGNGVYVGVGRGVYTGVTGMDWNLRMEQFEDINLQRVIFANGIFLAVGIDTRRFWGVIFTSVDGENWTRRLTNRPVHDVGSLPCAAFGNETFVVAGDSIVFTSTDGDNWTDAPGVSSKYFWSVVHGEGLIVAAGSARSGQKNSSLIATSHDGLTWITREVKDISGIISIAHGNGTFAARSYVGLLTSTNGLTWTATDLPGHFGNTISFAHDRFFLCGNRSAINTSTDGRTWTQYSTGTTNEIRAVAYGNGRFVAVGGVVTWPLPFIQLSGIPSPKNIILTSTDGNNWEIIPQLPGSIFVSVVFGNGKFIATRSGDQELISSDGLNWERGHSNLFDVERAKVIYSSGRFFTWANPYLESWSSTDGMRWKEHVAPGLYRRTQDYAFARDRLIAVGDATIWRSGPVPALYKVSATADDEIFILEVKESETRTSDLEVRYSMEVTGIEGQINTETNIIRIPAGKQTFYLEVPPRPFTQARLTLLPNPAYEVASPNSAILTPVNPGAAPRFRRVGTVKLSTSEMQIHLEAPAGSNILVESSTNLSNWTAAGPHTNVSDKLLLKVPIQINEGGRYYRARILAN